jgi:hypothetical protein
MSLFTLVALIIAAGILSWLVGKAPFIDPPYQAFARYAILVAVVLYILYCFFGPFPDVRIPGRRG